MKNTNPLHEWTDKQLAEEYYRTSKRVDKGRDSEGGGGTYDYHDDINKTSFALHLLYRNIIVCQECGEWWKLTPTLHQKGKQLIRYKDSDLDDEIECEACGNTDFITRREYDERQKEARHELGKHYKNTGERPRTSSNRVRVRQRNLHKE